MPVRFCKIVEIKKEVIFDLFSQLAPSLGLPDFTSFLWDKLLAKIIRIKKEQHFHVTLFFAPPIGESYNFDAMVIYLTIRKTKS